jgi:hypothetical protein
MEEDESSEFVPDSDEVQKDEPQKDEVQEDEPLPTRKYSTCRATPSSLSPSLSTRVSNVQLR